MRAVLAEAEYRKIDDDTVSAVIPVYNAATYLDETVRSLLCQERPLSELIIVDDASTDNTYEIVEKWTKVDKRVRGYRFLQNKGVSATRNFGIQMANSDWLLFFDGDDIADPRLVSLQLNRVQELVSEGYQNILLVHSAYQQVDQCGEKIQGITRWRQSLPQEVFGYFLLRNRIMTPSGAMVRKDILMQSGCFDPDIHYAEDWDLWLRLAQQGGFGYVDEPLVLVRRHGNNVSNALADMLAGERCILQKYSVHLIKVALFQRNLPLEVNTADYVAMLFRLEQWEEGYRFLAEMNSQSPTFATGFFLIGLYYLKRQEWQQAKLSFMRTLELDELHGAALNNMGALLIMEEKREAALWHLNKALELLSGYMDATRNMNLLIQEQVCELGYEELHFTWRELRPVLLSYTD